MELIITTDAARTAWPRGIPDSFGTIIQDADHRGEFTFRRGGGVRAATTASTRRARARRLRRAGHRWTGWRSPRAARPRSRSPSRRASSRSATAPRADRPDMNRHVNFGMSRWVIDGGVLANQPLRPALRAIFRQPASRQVRRVLAFVVPDPGEAVQVDRPTTSARVRRAHRGRRREHDQAAAQPVDQRRARRDHGPQRARWTPSGASASCWSPSSIPDDLAAAVYDHYRATRANELTRWLFNLLANDFSELELVDRDFVGEAPLRERARLREELVKHLGTLPPDEFPSTADQAEQWFTTRDTAERAAAVVLDLLRRGLAASSPDHAPSKDARKRIRAIRKEAVPPDGRPPSACASRLEKDADVDRAKAALNALRGGTLPQWADDVLPEILGDPESAAADRGAPSPTSCVPAAEAVQRGLRAAPPQHGADRRRQTAAYAARLVRRRDGPRVRAAPPARPRGRAARARRRSDHGAARRAASRSAPTPATASTRASAPRRSSPGSRSRTSGRSTSDRGGRTTGCGGATTPCSGSSRSCSTRHACASSASARWARSRRSSGSPSRAWSRRTRRTCAPPRLGRGTAQTAADELELPRQARDDTAGGAADVRTGDRPPAPVRDPARRSSATSPRRSAGTSTTAPPSPPPPGSSATSTWPRARPSPHGCPPRPRPSCSASARSARRRSATRPASDLLARTATQTLAVATSALSSETSGLPKPVREPLRTARGLALMIYLFVRHALSRQRAGSLYATAALAAGAVLVGVGLFVDIPGDPHGRSASACSSAPSALAALRRKLWRLVGVLLLGLADRDRPACGRLAHRRLDRGRRRSSSASSRSW